MIQLNSKDIEKLKIGDLVNVNGIWTCVTTKESTGSFYTSHRFVDHSNDSVTFYGITLDRYIPVCVPNSDEERIIVALSIT